MPVEKKYKPRRTVRSATKTAGLGCIRKCKDSYAMGDIDEVGLEECLRKCQEQAA